MDLIFAFSPSFLESALLQRDCQSLPNVALHNHCACCDEARWSRRSLLALSVGALSSGLTGKTSAQNRTSLVEPSLRLSLAPDQERVVALTLDACSGGFDHKVIEALVSWRVPSTLFLTARWIRSNPEGLKIILEHHDLFAIGNHGAEHIAAVLGTAAIFGVRTAGNEGTIRAEVIGGADAIQKTTGLVPKWYRGATALYSPEALPLIKSLGFSVAGFSLNADEGASLSASAVTERMKRARHGDVIIAHMNQPHHPSGAGVVAGVRALLDQGVIFTKLEAGTPIFASLDRYAL
jgi:peptidoglycan/xylan/chitin deacetylase (PgdA/CDA1 family)